MAITTAVHLVRVLIVDSQALFRAGLAHLLNADAGFRVVGEAQDGEQALRMIPAASPDVVVMDVELPGMGAVALTRRIATDHPQVRVLVLASRYDDTNIIAMLQAGAAGYLLKDSDARAVAHGIRAVLGGERVLSAMVGDRVLKLLTGEAASAEDYDGLTARELEVLKLVAAGTAYKQVARVLRISHKTVRTHVCHIYEKLEIYDRAQVVRYALRKGLVEL